MYLDVLFDLGLAICNAKKKLSNAKFTLVRFLFFFSLPTASAHPLLTETDKKKTIIEV